MTHTDQKVIEIAARELGIEPSSLSDDSRLEDIFTDSLEFICFVQALNEIGYMDETTAANALTIGDLADALNLPN